MDKDKQTKQLIDSDRESSIIKTISNRKGTLNLQLQQINILQGPIKLINMFNEKPCGSGYIRSDILGQILLLVYRGIKLDVAIKTVIEKYKSHVKYSTRRAYIRDYKLFFKRVFQNIQNGGKNE
jgi:hypothetical protein